MLKVVFSRFGCHSSLIPFMDKEPPMSARSLLPGIVLGGLGILLSGSVFVWRQCMARRRKCEPILTWNDEPRAAWNSAPEIVVIYVALLWMSWHLLVQFLRTTPRSASAPNDSALVEMAGFNIVLSFIFPLAIVSSRRPWSLFGLRTSHFRDQLAVGVEGFFAAVLPMTISMFLTLPFRGKENQNPLLTSLADSSNLTTIFLIFVLAAISAPLLEEMLFRVILQGWLARIFPAPIAITIVAVLFSMVHGWRDGIALLPLALILGYVFHRRHSYVAVVVIHSLFNATIVVLQLLKPELSS